MSKFYFRNLDGIRFIGALMVIIHHIEQNKSVFGIRNAWTNSVIQSIGPLGVNLFFTLSGFLITYLLIHEYNSNKAIDIKSFYIRRILRIWPLYFLLIILGFFLLPLVVPAEFNVFNLPNYGQRLLLFCTFLPNVSYIVNGTTPFVHQLWSIGVEEQFYLVWPLLILLSPGKKTSVLLFFLTYMSAVVLVNKFAGSETILYKILSKARFSAMAIGGLMGYIVYYKTKGYQLIQSGIFGWLTFIITILLIVKSVYVPYIGYEIYAVLFAILIAHFSVSPKPIFSLDYDVFNYFGKISYGLYMYHSIMIFLSIKFLQLFNLQAIQLLVYILSITSTIFISHISYKYLEAYFLKMKSHFERS